MEENFYLEQLNKLTKELKSVMNNSDSMSPCVYNCVLAGIIIRMNSIIDQCMLDFHSESFINVAEAIYNSRQLLVHYSDYRTFSNLEEISNEIIERFYAAYPNEQEYFKNVLNYKDTLEHNVVIPKNRDVVYDEFTNSYVFMSEGVEISVSSDKVIRIQDLVKRRDLAYIVNCDTDMNYFYKDEDYEIVYQELRGHEELQEFFLKNFNVVGMDYNKHKVAIREVLDRFYKPNSYNAIYVMKSQSKDVKRKPLYLETSKVLDSYFNQGVFYSQFLDERIYSNLNIPEQSFLDYKAIKDNCINDLNKNITKRDYFFTVKAISMFDSLNQELKKGNHLSESQKEKLKMAMLINWSDHTFRNMTNEFIECNQEFKDLHFKLLSYRTFFAHNVLQLKSSTSPKILDEFYDIARGYVSILSSLHVPDLGVKDNKEIMNFLAIERMPSHFINSKHEQFVQIDPNTYIGDKLFYSTRGSEYRKIIGLVPVDKNCPLRGTYYEKKEDKFVAKQFKTKGGKKKNLLVSKIDYSKGKEVCLDVNVDDLLTIYAAYKGKMKKYPVNELDGANYKKAILFYPSAENNHKQHAIELDEVISNYYQQRYLPFELVKETKLATRETDMGKKYFCILDEKDKEIACVVNCNELKDINLNVDEKGFFTINETIHNFANKRRNK